MPTPLFALVRGATSAPGAAPSLSSLSVDLADPAGGDLITVTGTNLGSAISCTVAGSPVTINANTATSLTFTFPSGLASGGYFVQVTTAAGPSNTILIEAWAPTTDASCTLFFDSKHTPYVAGTAGTWAPRYSASPVTPNDILENNSFATGKHSVNAGAPVFDGNGAVEGGLTHPSNAWTLHYLGAASSGHVAGSIFAVCSYTNSQSMVATDASGTIYDDPVILATGLGTLALCAGTRAGDSVPIVRGFIYNGTDGYRGPTVEVTQGVQHAFVLRWGLGSGSVDLSVDGALSGASYGSRSTTQGLDQSYLAYVFQVGISRTYNNVSFQHYAGTIRAWGVLNAKASDTFITKLNKWRQARGWS